MAPTEAELKLQKKYEELRKKKEAKLKAKQQQKGQPEEQKAKQPPVAAATASAAPAVARPLGLPVKQPAVPAARAPVAAKPADPVVPSVPGETAKERAIRLLAAKRAAAGGGTAFAAPRRPAAQASGDAAPFAPKFTIPKRAPAARPSDDQATPAAEAPKLTQEEIRQRAVAAQQAARQQQEQQRQQGTGGAGDGGGAPKRPALKRPSAARAVPKEGSNDGAAAKRHRLVDGGWGGGQGNGGGAADGQAVGHEFAPWQGHSEEAGDDGRRSTLFVGDLPPHYDSAAVHDIFAELAPVENARVVGTQCYAFVRFQSPRDAAYIMERQNQTPLAVEGGRQLRINWAHGQLPEWKQGSQMAQPVAGGRPGLDQYEHPKVREARLAAQAAADAFDPGALAEVELRPPPQRALVVYDDL